MLEGLGDAELLVLARGRPEAFAVFYRRHAHDLLRFFARRTLDPDAAAELTAETFAQALGSVGAFRDRGVGGAGWLYGIARHQLGRYHRRGVVDERARRSLGLPERDLSFEDYERIEELIDLESVRGALADAFAVLSADQREAMTLRVIEERTYEEIARAMRCTEDAARARVSRGLRRLSALLEQRHPELIGEMTSP